jgi:hypothetical protein
MVGDMNYFAHGVRFLSSPWFLAGTAAPDWLAVSDRKVRLREKQVVPFLEDADPRLKEFAAGVLQHLQDDDWFHQTREFYEINSHVADCFRGMRDCNDGFLPGFLGHISTELLLDRLLIEDSPPQLDEYYDRLRGLPAEEIQCFVNHIAPREATRLARFVQLFCEVQFLRDYLDNRLLLKRLNQVLQRVKLQPLPDSAEAVLDRSWEIIQQRGWRLLPAEKFVSRGPEHPSQNRSRTPLSSGD